MEDSRVAKHLLAPILLLVQPTTQPGTAAHAAWLALYEEMLDGFESEVMTHAAKKIARRWCWRSFPLPADLLKVCEESEIEVGQRRLPKPGGFPQATIDCVVRCKANGLSLPKHISQHDVLRMEEQGLV